MRKKLFNLQTSLVHFPVGSNNSFYTFSLTIGGDMIPVNSRSHYVPSKPNAKDCCPCTITPFYQTSELPAGDRMALLRQYTTMRLVHMAKDNTLKHAFSLKHVHEDLATTSLVLSHSGASNILLSKMTFECLITTPEGEERDTICIPFKVKGANTEKESVLSYEMLEKAYKGKRYLYGALKYLYTYGRRIANPGNVTHGHSPDYDPDSSSHDQYIRHTEQLLVAYLALPEAAQMLCEQIRGAVRAKHNLAIDLKIVNIGLHMHSTKTCCAPCEYTLLGLMNDRNGFSFRDDPEFPHHLGFLSNFAREAVKPNQVLPIRLPRRSPLRLVVTVTASNPDADHKSQTSYRKVELVDASAPFYNILIKSAKTSSTIFTTMVNTTHDQRKIPQETNLSDVSVGISGSKSSPGSPGTINKVKTLRRTETDTENVINKMLNWSI
jgi:hypothetical protein